MLSGVLQLPLAPSHCGDQDIGAKTSSTVCMMKTRMPWELELPAPPREQRLCSASSTCPLVPSVPSAWCGCLLTWCHQDPTADVSSGLRERGQCSSLGLRFGGGSRPPPP